MQQLLFIIAIFILFFALGFAVSFGFTLLYKALSKIKPTVYQYNETVDMHRLRRQPAPSIVSKEETADGQTGYTDYHLH